MPRSKFIPGCRLPAPKAERLDDMSKETVFSNARIVLEDDILLGSILIRDGKIADISGVTR